MLVEKLDEYEARIDPLRVQYHADFAEIETAWIRKRQAVIDRVERDVPGANLAHDGLIDFLSAPIDARHERAVTDLFAAFSVATAAIAKELNL